MHYSLSLILILVVLCSGGCSQKSSSTSDQAPKAESQDKEAAKKNLKPFEVNSKELDQFTSLTTTLNFLQKNSCSFTDSLGLKKLNDAIPSSKGKEPTQLVGLSKQLALGKTSVDGMLKKQDIKADVIDILKEASAALKDLSACVDDALALGDNETMHLRMANALDNLDHSFKEMKQLCDR